LIEPATLEWLYTCVGYQPRNIEIFERALTHGSTGKPDYQRLEFLGDRVLGLVIAEMLYARYHDEAEGRLSHRLNALVAGATCAQIARDIGLPPHLKLGKQARDDGAQASDNVLGDVIESIIGAIFLDQGIDAAREFVITRWTAQIESAPSVPNNRKTPEYTVTHKEGPPHAMRFEVTVAVKGFDPISATANSKQAAETAVAELFLEQYA
jgi:ribonuclease III